MGNKRIEFISRLLLSLSVIMVVMTQTAWGRDLDERYKNSPLHDWFEHLASGKGLCCSSADGYVVQDADWESRGGHYRVRVPKTVNSDAAIWVDVPDEAVITEPNRAGHTMVWPSYGSGDSLFHAGQHDLALVWPLTLFTVRMSTPGLSQSKSGRTFAAHLAQAEQMNRDSKSGAEHHRLIGHR
jgi:hypothetical protein